MADPVPELIRRLGLDDRVLWFGHVDDEQLRGLYAGASAYLYPSLVEGVGLPLLEAMACGTPVVASDIPVFREFGGGAALYVDALDPHGWARAVRTLSDSSQCAERVSLAASSTWPNGAAVLLNAMRINVSG